MRYWKEWKRRSAKKAKQRAVEYAARDLLSVVKPGWGYSTDEIALSVRDARRIVSSDIDLEEVLKHIETNWYRYSCKYNVALIECYPHRDELRFQVYSH